MPSLKSILIDIISADLQPRSLTVLHLGYKFFTRVFVLCLVGLCQNLFALGLGEIEINSVINEPLSATIEVLDADGVENDELLVVIASATDYQVAGVSWDFSHTELDFNVNYAANGDLIVNITSERAIREPYLSILVQARWPAGRLLREYTILLDFPVFTGEQSSSVSAPSQSLPAPTSTPAPQPVQQSVAPRATAASSPVPRIVSGAPNTPARSLSDGDYRIENGDTLWSLGGRVAQDLGVTRHQAMLAIREANPEAFSQGNLNMLRSGSLIRVPTRSEALDRSTTEAADQYVQAMRSNGQFIADATPLQSRATDFREDAGSANENGGQFRLASTEQNNTGAGGSGLSEIESENQLLSDVNSALQEELEAAEIENQDLSERLRNLEEQISVMEALIEVENNEIRAVQEAITAPEPEPVVNPINTANIQEESLITKLMGWLPVLGLVLIGLLVGAYLVIRRRKSSNDASDITGFDEEYDESAPIYAEDEQDADEKIQGEQQDEESLEDFLPEEIDSIEYDTNDIGGEEQVEPNAVGLEEPAENNPEDENEDWDSDFDDLDSFFDEVEEPASASLSEESEEEVQLEQEQVAEVADEEEESEKTQIFDASSMAEIMAENAISDEEHSEDEIKDEVADDNLMDFESAELDEADSGSESVDEENMLDFSLDEGDLSREEETTDTPFESENLEEDEEFSLDFELDADDLEPQETVDAEESEELDLPKDENTLSFDVSDMDLSDKAPAVEPEESIEAASELESENSVLENTDITLDSSDEEQEESELDVLDLSEFGDEELSSDESDEAVFIDVADENEDIDSLLGDLGADLNDLDTFDSEDSIDSKDEVDNIDAAFDIDLNEDLNSDEDSDLSSLLDENPDDSTVDPQNSLGDSDLLDAFDDELDLSDFNKDDSSADMAEECETKMELAIAYMEMGDNSGAKELLEEVVREGDDSYKEKANALLEGLD